MRIFFSVGEPSGDLHGSNLIRELKERVPELECVGFGGPKMHAVGCTLIYELTQLAVMFFADAIKNLRFFFKLIDQADNYFATHQVDAVILIDYPGFNWWIAKKAKKHQIPVFYYGVPQVWAWAPWRVRKIRRLVDHVLCKLPFEVKWFEDRNCRATYVGHPFFDQLAGQDYDQAFLDRTDGQPLLTLLPGSRDREVEHVLPILIQSAKRVREQHQCRIAIAAYNAKQGEVASRMVQDSGLKAEVHVGRTPELMKMSRVCLACSGSVSLELLFHRKPTVIVFKVKRWMMVAQAFLLRTRFITLTNLIGARDIRKRTWRPFNPDRDPESALMPEYLTTGDPSESVANQAIGWLNDPVAYQKKVAELDDLALRYAKPGATKRAAEYILSRLNSPIGHCSQKQVNGSAEDANSNRAVA